MVYGQTDVLVITTNPTGHTLVESTLFPRYLNESTLNQRGKVVDITPVGYALDNNHS
jgi:hypothetical protein